MKTLIFVLIISSLLQSTILAIVLVLIILICRSYIRPDRANLLLAFGFGLLNAHLSLTTMGIQSLIYLTLVLMTQSLSKTRLAGNSLLIVPLSLFLLSINQMLMALFLHHSVQLFPKVFIEVTLSLPILFLIRFWEERFIIRKEIKLRV